MSQFSSCESSIVCLLCTLDIISQRCALACLAGKSQDWFQVSHVRLNCSLSLMNIPFQKGVIHQKNLCTQVPWVNIGLSMDAKKYLFYFIKVACMMYSETKRCYRNPQMGSMYDVMVWNIGFIALKLFRLFMRLFCNPNYGYLREMRELAFHMLIYICCTKLQNHFIL